MPFIVQYSNHYLSATIFTQCGSNTLSFEIFSAKTSSLCLDEVAVVKLYKTAKVETNLH